MSCSGVQVCDKCGRRFCSEDVFGPWCYQCLVLEDINGAVQIPLLKGGDVDA